jgi:hypothetical protein
MTAATVKDIPAIIHNNNAIANPRWAGTLLTALSGIDQRQQ